MVSTPKRQFKGPSTASDLGAWLTDYQWLKQPTPGRLPLHPKDPELLLLFEAYYNDNNSSGQQNAYSKIVNLISATGLLWRGLSPEKQADAMFTFYDKMADQWLLQDELVLTPQLLTTIEQYCHNHQNKRAENFRKHLETLSNHHPQTTDQVASKAYRNAQRYLKENIVNLLDGKHPEDGNAQPLFKPYACWEPRLKHFRCETNSSITESLATWIRASLSKRQDEYQQDSYLSLDGLLGDSEDGGTFIDCIQNNSQPWQQEAPTLANPSSKKSSQPKPAHWRDTIRGKSIPNFSDLGNLDPEQQDTSTLADGLVSQAGIPLLDCAHVEGYPQCSRRQVAQRLLLKEPVDPLEAIAQDNGIPFKEFYKALPATFEAIEQYSEELGLEPQPPWRTHPRLRADLLTGYIKADPDEWLYKPLNRAGTYPTGQEVAERLYFKDPADTIRAIAEEFNLLEITPKSPEGKVPDNFYQAIKGNTRKNINDSAWGLVDRLAGSLAEYYPNPTRLRMAIQRDRHNLLKRCAVKGHPLCNAQFLTLRRLRILGNFQSFAAIAQELAQQGDTLKPDPIERHWYSRCLHRLGRLIQILDRRTKKENSEAPRQLSETGGQS